MSEGAWNGIVGWAKKQMSSHDALYGPSGKYYHDRSKDEAIFWASDRIKELETQLSEANERKEELHYTLRAIGANCANYHGDFSMRILKQVDEVLKESD